MSAEAAIGLPARSPVTTALRPTLLNLGSVLGGEALLRLGNFAAAVVIARLYGVATFGVYATALAYVTVAAMIADNGLQTSAIQQVSRSSAGRAAIVSRLYAAKTALLSAAVVLLLAIAAAARLSSAVWWIAALVALRTVLQSYAQLQAAILKALDRMGVIGKVQSFHFGFLLAGIALVYRGRHAINALLVVMVAGQALELLGSALYLRSYGIRAAAVRLGECWKLVRDATPMGLTYTLASIGLRLDVVLLSWLAPASALGQFAAAQSLLVVLAVAAWLFGSVLLGELSRLVDHPNAFERSIRRWTRLLLLVLVPASLAGMGLAPLVVRVVFGEAFAPAARIIAILLIAAPFAFLNSLYLNRAIAREQRSLYVGAYAGALLLGIVLALVLARNFGATGIAMAAVVREVALFVTLATPARRVKVAA